MTLSTVSIIVLLFFISIAVFSFLLNGLLLKFSKTLGIRNNTDTVIRWSSTSKPALGGISFFICFLISLAGYAIFFSEDNPLYHDKKILGLLASAGIAFLMGLSDDAYNTKPLFKLLTQVICGVILIFSGVYISLFESNTLNYVITVLWVVGMMNSINMLDNMDAITAIVSAAIILSAIIIYFFTYRYSMLNLLMLVGVLAAISGFLFYNWHPSKIFMGDTGSQFLGLFLAAFGIMFFWNAEYLPPFHEAIEAKSKHVVIALLAFIVPIVDTTTVTINRILRGQSPFVGGRDHTTHSLSYLGFSDVQIALIFAGISMVSFALIIIINNVLTWNYFYFIVFSTYFLLVFLALFGCTRFEKVKQKINV